MIEITQADRWILAQHYQKIRDYDYAGWIMAGKKDNESELQRLASHRINSTAHLQAQLDMAVTALTSIKALDPDCERDAEDVAQEAIDIASAALGDES